MFQFLRIDRKATATLSPQSGMLMSIKILKGKPRLHVPPTLQFLQRYEKSLNPEVFREEAVTYMHGISLKGCNFIQRKSTWYLQTTAGERVKTGTMKVSHDRTAT